MRSILSSGANGREVIICSDSEELIGAALSSITTSEMVKGLVWVSGRESITGNEEADRLAKHGSSSRDQGVEPYLPVPQSLCVDGVRSGVHSECASSWITYDGGKHFKYMLPVPNESC